MATLSVGLQHKTVGETQRGELFRVSLQGAYATCVTIETAEAKDPMIGILEWKGIDRPTYLVHDGSKPCVSFGTDWVIEPVFGPESFPGNMQIEDDERILFVQTNDALLRFDRIQDPNSYDCFWGSLKGGGRPNRAREAVPFLRWNIWLTADDQLRPGATPFVEFGE